MNACCRSGTAFRSVLTAEGILHFNTPRQKSTRGAINRKHQQTL